VSEGFGKSSQKDLCSGKLPAALIMAHSYDTPDKVDEIMSLLWHYRVACYRGLKMKSTCSLCKKN